MRGNYVMLVRFFLFLIIAFPAFSCEKSLEAVRLIDINYVTDIEGIFKKYKVEVEKKVIFGQEILTAKSDFISRGFLDVEVYKFEIIKFKGERFIIEFSINNGHSFKHEMIDFDDLINKIKNIEKSTTCSDEISEAWMDLAVLLEITAKPRKRNLYVDEQNRQVIIFDGDNWNSFYPSKDGKSIIVASAYIDN